MSSLSERPQMSRAEWVEDRRQHVFQTIKEALNGQLNLLLTAQEAEQWRFAFPELTKRVSQEDTHYLKQINRESRELPLSTERQYWAVESLREKDAIARVIERRVRDGVLLAFAHIADDLNRML